MSLLLDCQRKIVQKLLSCYNKVVTTRSNILEEGRTLNGLAAEYGIAKASISNWVKQFREECQVNNKAQAEYDCMKENLQLKKQLAELKKENDFLKKAAAFFAKEID